MRKFLGVNIRANELLFAEFQRVRALFSPHYLLSHVVADLVLMSSMSRTMGF